LSNNYAFYVHVTAQASSENVIVISLSLGSFLGNWVVTS